MITKGYIEEIVDKNKVVVRCPVYDKIQTATNNNTPNNRFSICTITGVKMNIRAGDVVFIGFEDSNLYNGVLLGYLSKDSETLSYIDVNALSLGVSSSAVLPKQTTIGSVSWFDIQNLSGIKSNIKEQIQKIELTKEKAENYIEDLNTKLKEHEKLVDEIVSKINSQKELISKYISLIGEETDTKEDTFYGRLNSYNNLIDNINTALGAFPEGVVLSEKINELSEMCVELSNGIVNSSPIYSEEESENSMLARAEKMINVPWEAKTTFSKWNSSQTFNKGTTYYGMPYTLFWYGYKYEDWKRNSDKNVTRTEYCSGYGNRTGPMYGSCCADFVSEVFGLPKHQRSCSGLKTNCPDYLETITGEKAKAQYIKTGDAIINVGNGHVMWVGGVSGNELTVYEQTPPQAHKITLSTTKNITSDGYIFWGKKYDTIVRPRQALLDLEINQQPEHSEAAGDWIYKGNRINNRYSEQALTETEYMHNALVFWKLMKKAGWTAEAAAGAWANTYGESTGNPWAYGTGGGGLFGFTPFDKGTYELYGTRSGIYDYAQDVLHDVNRRWNGDDQVGYINWQISERLGVFFIRKADKYWKYDPPSNTRIPKTNFGLSTYIKLNQKDYDATATICAKLWLARYGVVDTTYSGRDLNKTIKKHSEKAEELYQMFIRT